MAKRGVVLGILGIAILSVSLALSVPYQGFGAKLGKLQSAGGSLGNGTPGNGLPGTPGNGDPGDARPGVPVVVTNGINQPIPVEVTKSQCTCGTPFSKFFIFEEGQETLDIFTVPTGKRLILELCTFTLTRSTGSGSAVNLLVLPTAPPTLLLDQIYYLSASLDYSFSGFSGYVGTHLVKIYVEAGKHLAIKPSVIPGVSSIVGSLSGRLEDVP
jgi:hypothetical protein